MSGGITAVAAGSYHTLAIKNGALYSWGQNSAGALGNGTTNNSNVPTVVSGMTSGVTAVAAGAFHSLAIQNGALYAWGNNTYGDLGDGTTTQRSSPVPVLSLATGVTSIAAGHFFSLAVQNGHVFAWGYNGYGQLGNGNLGTYSSTPIQIDPTDLHDIVEVAAGNGSSYALSSDGSLWVWGEDESGQLGTGSNSNSTNMPQHLLAPLGYEFTGIDADAYGSHAVATIAVVPEPSTYAMLGVGLAALLALRRRKRLNLE